MSLPQSDGADDASLLNHVESGRHHTAKAGLRVSEMSLQDAKKQIGSAFRVGVKRSDAAFKEFGDSGQISRICAGDEREIPNWLARAWVRDDTRKQLVMALADASGFFEARVQLTEKRGA